MFENFNNSSMRETVKDKVVFELLKKEGRYSKLVEVAGQKKVILGFYFSNKGKFGKNVSVVSDNTIINLPKRYVEKFEALTDDEVNELLTGYYYLDNIHEISTNNGKTCVFDIVKG